MNANLHELVRKGPGSANTSVSWGRGMWKSGSKDLPERGNSKSKNKIGMLRNSGEDSGWNWGSVRKEWKEMQ